jgi:molybdopterin/thiamine biosynthesis adenylyltransferase
MLVIWILAVLIGFGWALKLPWRGIGAMVLGLWLAVVVVHLVLPVGHPLTVALGGSRAGWIGLGVVALLMAAYRAGLKRLHARARPMAETAPQRPGSFSETELDRYARHIVLREIGGPGQKKLKNAKVLVVGAGGLGSPALLYLAAAGVGRIGVVDDDTVSNSNLQRQVIHTDARIDMPKVFSAEAQMKALNPFIEVRPYNRRLTAADAAALFADYDVVLDGCDNFATRRMINAACVAAKKPLISGAIAQWEGQLSLFDPARGAPCYHCLFPEDTAPGLAPPCAEAGVVGALPGVIGAMMALEAIKLITGAGETLRGRLMIYDALWGETRQIGLKKRDDCAVCGTGSGL